jgi:hypothetical protein
MDDKIDLIAYLGLPEGQIPRRMRDPGEEGIGFCSSLAILFEVEDPRTDGAPIDIRSGGLVGWKRFCEVLGGVSQPTARRILAKPFGQSVQKVAGQPGTTITTATCIRSLHAAAVAEERRIAGRRGGRPRTRDLAPGSTGLVRQPVVETSVADTEPQPAGVLRVSGAG